VAPHHGDVQWQDGEVWPSGELQRWPQKKFDGESYGVQRGRTRGGSSYNGEQLEWGGFHRAAEEGEQADDDRRWWTSMSWMFQQFQELIRHRGGGETEEAVPREEANGSWEHGVAADGDRRRRW
jgi:hypothetical protein